MAQTLHNANSKFRINKLYDQYIHWMFRILISCLDSLLIHLKYKENSFYVGISNFSKVFCRLLPNNKIPITTTKNYQICKLSSFILYWSCIKGKIIKIMLIEIWTVQKEVKRNKKWRKKDQININISNNEIVAIKRT